jgi:hypothetical protein
VGEELARDEERMIRDLRDKARRLGLLPVEEDATYQQYILHLRWRMWLREYVPYRWEQIKEHAITVGVCGLLLVLSPLLLSLSVVIGAGYLIAEAVRVFMGRNDTASEDTPIVSCIVPRVRDKENAALEASAMAELVQLEHRLFGVASFSMPPVETPSVQEENEQAAT